MKKKAKEEWMFKVNRVVNLSTKDAIRYRVYVSIVNKAGDIICLGEGEEGLLTSDPELHESSIHNVIRDLAKKSAKLDAVHNYFAGKVIPRYKTKSLKK
jgi:hypothetical protein